MFNDLPVSVRVLLIVLTFDFDIKWELSGVGATVGYNSVIPIVFLKRLP